MADLIDRDLTIYELEAFKESCVANLLRMSFDDITDVVKDIPAVNRWIPVEDALPETTDTFLVIVEANGEREYVVATYARYTGHWIDKECRVLNGVTHFMNMPEPPESEVQHD